MICLLYTSKLCDRVAILKEGQLIGIQSIKELRESGYKKVSLKMCIRDRTWLRSESSCCVRSFFFRASRII